MKSIVKVFFICIKRIVLLRFPSFTEMAPDNQLSKNTSSSPCLLLNISQGTRADVAVWFISIVDFCGHLLLRDG